MNLKMKAYEKSRGEKQPEVELIRVIRVDNIGAEMSS